MKFNKKLWKPLARYGNILFIDNNNRNIGCGKMKYSFTNEIHSEGVELCNITAEGFKSACVTKPIRGRFCD